MKKDRDCGMTPYPVYPAYQGMNMGMVPPFGMPNQNMGMMQPFGMTNPTMNMGMSMPYNQSVTNPTSVSTNTVEQQLNTMQQQINSLEKRISTLETMFNNSNISTYSNNKYNSSNFQMM